MFVADLLVALLVALVLVAIFGMGVRGDSFGVGLFWFFFILFLATWAGGVWLPALGPAIMGVSWLTYLLVGLFFALLIMALLPPASPPPRPSTAGREVEADAGAFAVLNIFFWILLVGLVAVITIAYFV